MSSPKILVAAVAAAAFSLAFAQSAPPRPGVTNPAIGAGQQSTHLTPMGETGVLTHPGELRTAAITKEPEVATVAPAPEPVAAAPAAPAPEPVAAAPAPEPAQTMGAAPEPEPQKVARADRG